MNAVSQNVRAVPRRSPPRFITVGRRTYRRKSRRDRRHWIDYSYPELRLSNAWLREAGFRPGDRVLVSSPRHGFIVVGVLPQDPADQRGLGADRSR